MPVLKERERKYVKSLFERELSGEVRLVVVTQRFECEGCEVTRNIAEELAELSNMIKVEVYDFESDADKLRRWRVDKIPALLVFGKREYGVRYFGMPTGYEFAALLDDIVDVSRGSSRLSQTTKQRLAEIREPVHIQVFVTPTCPYCPKAVRIAHQMAVENEHVVADMIESLEFPHLANRYGVMAVPKVVINDIVSFEGALQEQHFLEYVVHALEHQHSHEHRH
ncbi:MAG: thioredoxin family protein [Thaumarchaeota archaeon]|nr:thioredoxin family protein [Candidatus Calditenuaceae archaeon]MDW8187139.1 thioredoxin family protein [Nitrososphaerota archaeon]